MPNRPLHVLSIGAHPADIFDQSGGTMAHHAARGDYVACVALTHGARVHDKVISDSMFRREQVPIGDELLKLMAERFDVKAEVVRRACGILGFQDMYFFGENDAVLLMTEGVGRLDRRHSWAASAMRQGSRRSSWSARARA
jgi:LmbE family N-acetylglucosaminyl deacetylase